MRFSLGTLAINVSGSFLIGLLLSLATDRVVLHPNWRLGVVVGFIGAYTTFSTFEYETFKLLETGSGISGFLNVVVSLLLGFLAVWGGVAVAGAIPGRALVPSAAQHESVRPGRGRQSGSVSSQTTMTATVGTSEP
jgi:CrcB protein